MMAKLREIEQSVSKKMTKELDLSDTQAEDKDEVS
jgi:hypothetical protein